MWSPSAPTTIKKATTEAYDQKQWALLHLLKRSNKPIDGFVNALEGVVQQLMDSYEWLDDKWRDDQERFLQLMIMYGLLYACDLVESSREVRLPWEPEPQYLAQHQERDVAHRKPDSFAGSTEVVGSLSDWRSRSMSDLLYLSLDPYGVLKA